MHRSFSNQPRFDRPEWDDTTFYTTRNNKICACCHSVSPEPHHPYDCPQRGPGRPWLQVCPEELKAAMNRNEIERNLPSQPAPFNRTRFHSSLVVNQNEDRSDSPEPNPILVNLPKTKPEDVPCFNAPQFIVKAIMQDRFRANALIDTGASCSFIPLHMCQKMKLQMTDCSEYSGTRTVKTGMGHRSPMPKVATKTK